MPIAKYSKFFGSVCIKREVKNRLREIADRRGLKMSQLVTDWVYSQPEQEIPNDENSKR